MLTLQVADYAGQFQCNETFAVAASRLSELMSLPFMTLLLAASAYSWPEQICPWWFSSQGISGPQPFRLCCWTLLCVTLTLLGWTRLMLDPMNRTKMTYTGKQTPGMQPTANPYPLPPVSYGYTLTTCTYMAHEAGGTSTSEGQGSLDSGASHGPPGSLSATRGPSHWFLDEVASRPWRGARPAKTGKVFRRTPLQLRTRTAPGVVFCVLPNSATLHCPKLLAVQYCKSCVANYEIWLRGASQVNCTLLAHLHSSERKRNG